MHHDTFQVFHKTGIQVFWTNHLSKNYRGCLLVGTKTTTQQLYNSKCLYSMFANHHICVVLWLVYIVFAAGIVQIMLKSKYTWILKVNYNTILLDYVFHFCRLWFKVVVLSHYFMGHTKMLILYLLKAFMDIGPPTHDIQRSNNYICQKLSTRNTVHI